MENLQPFYGFFLSYEPWACLASIFIILVIGYMGAPFFLWALAAVAILIGYGAAPWLIYTVAIVSLIFIIAPIRKNLISNLVMKVMKGIVPAISETERTALEAGKVWIEKEFFGGKPNFKKMLEENYPKLTDEEQKFMDDKVAKVCAMTDDWEVTINRSLPKETWEYLKKEKFFGMIIPKEYGGLGFSNFLHSSVIKTLSTRSVPLCTTVMVPNSLGPAELLIHYGTDEQKKKYLPRLAVGDEIPCFALTEPGAGSDAGAMTSHGELFKGDDGKLYIKLNWNKRYITLAAIATLLGLAFKLRDPKNLLGRGEDLGITCALIPANTPGVVLGRRHDPLNVPFYNCPTQGKDVVVPMSAVIGEEKGCGHGWTMLMECLAAGRGISLPAQSTGGIELAALGVSAHATARKQFGMSIGKFEGIEESLARIVGFGYILESQRRLTCGALDRGEKPPVVTAMCKYMSTEMMRQGVNDAMDILGGNGISRGPRNFIATGYTGIPIGITVEGANILTRTLIVFGQGALRAHPYAYKEVSAVEKGDLNAFDSVFWKHIGHVVTNVFRVTLLSITRGHLAISPVSGPTAKYFRRLMWSSAVFSLMTDVAMGTLGGGLKARGRITGRFADALSWMYFGFAVLHRFQHDGGPKEDIPLVEYSMQHAFSQMQKAFDGIFENLGVPVIGLVFKYPVRFWSGLNTFSHTPNDVVIHKLAKLIQQDTPQRDRLTSDVYMPQNTHEQVGRLNEAFKLVKKAEALERKVKKAVKAKTLTKKRGSLPLDEALEKNVITKEEFTILQRAEEMRTDAIQVDDFSHEEYFHAPKDLKLS